MVTENTVTIAENMTVQHAVRMTFPNIYFLNSMPIQTVTTETISSILEPDCPSVKIDLG